LCVAITNLTSGNKKCIASNPPDSDDKIKDRNVLKETKVKKQHELYLTSKSTTESKLKGNTITSNTFFISRSQICN
jgi:hypothetical protein